MSSGTFLTLDPVAVNLAGGGYLKVGVALELTTDGAAGGEGAASTGPRRSTSSSRRSPGRARRRHDARDALKAALQQKII